MFAAESHNHDELQIDFRIKRDVDGNEGGQLVGETKCENIPRRVCIPNNCGMTESKEEECHNKKSLVLQEIPEEVRKIKLLGFSLVLNINYPRLKLLDNRFILLFRLVSFNHTSVAKPEHD